MHLAAIAMACVYARAAAQIYTKLTERAADFKLVLDDVSITHLQFGKECVRAAAPLLLVARAPC